MPSAAATSSVCDSIAQQDCGAVGARTEPDGWWLVYTRWASTCRLGMRYGPDTCIAASCEKKPLSAVYAPLSMAIHALRAVIAAVVADTGGDVDHHALAPAVGSDELLAAGEDQPDRSLGRLGQGGDVRLVVEAALATEATTEVRDDDAHAVGRQAERLAHAGACVERHLRRGPDRDLVALPLGDDGAGFDRRGVAAVGNVATGDHMVGLGKAGVDVALGDRRERRIVAVTHQHVGGAVRLPVGVDEWRIRSECRLEVGDDRERFVLDDDRVDRLLCDRRSRGCDSSDDLALESHDVAGEQRAVLNERAEAHVGYVVGGQHGHDTWDGPRRRHVELGDASMGDVGVAELGGEHARQREVGGVPAAAGHLVGTVGADEAWLGCCRHGRQYATSAARRVSPGPVVRRIDLCRLARRPRDGRRSTRFASPTPGFGLTTRGPDQRDGLAVDDDDRTGVARLDVEGQLVPRPQVFALAVDVGGANVDESLYRGGQLDGRIVAVHDHGAVIAWRRGSEGNRFGQTRDRPSTRQRR